MKILWDERAWEEYLKWQTRDNYMYAILISPYLHRPIAVTIMIPQLFS